MRGTIRRSFAVAILCTSIRLVGQEGRTNQRSEPVRSQDMPQATVAEEIKGPVRVTVQADKPKQFLAPRALGVSWNMTGDDISESLMPRILTSAGVTTLRYPGGSFADTYHWSTNKTTGGQAIGANNDFGHFAKLLDQFGTAVISVNYGSNLDGTGGGTPEEAAAWVAYAMGNPSNNKPVGKDASGHDWSTVSYWATLRGSQPLPSDDGLNFLRIAHPDPILIKYWEVGNEVYRNGYYDGNGTEQDDHAPYAKDARDNERQRKRNAALSPDAYGNALVQYDKAMKAVDGRIKVGASLDIPLEGVWSGTSGGEDWVFNPVSRKWVPRLSAEGAGVTVVQKTADSGIDWDKNVLKVAGRDIDFVSLHWYAGDGTEASRGRDLDNGKTLMKPQEELPKMLAALLDLFRKYCGQNMQNMQVLMTELGVKSYLHASDELVPAIFAADAYATLVEDGVANIDWAQLHNVFLNDENRAGPVYFAPQLVRRIADLNDTLVTAASSNSLLAVHSAAHKDGSIGIMLINKDPRNNATARVSISGAKFATAGTRYDYGRNNPAKQFAIEGAPVSDLGNNFTVVVPSYTITDLVIPKAQ